MSVLRDVGCLQLDPISVVARSPLLVLWSRTGPYKVSDLDALLWKERRLFEYWAHAASIVLTEDYPIHHLLMRTRAKRLSSPSGSAYIRRLSAWYKENAWLRRHVLARLRHRGPLRLRDFEDRAVTGWHSGGWTTGRNVDRMLSILRIQGTVMVAGRTGLEKWWDLAERWLPAWTPRERLSDHEVVRRAAQRSLRALGVATARQIARHFTSGRYPGLDQIRVDLERHGLIERVTIADSGREWPGPWFVHRDDLPMLEGLENGEWVPRTTLLSPFDNLIIDRARTERLFGFHYRMEIYVPKVKRRYGYYALPILHHDRLIGRLDPMMDRRNQRVIVNAVHAEPGVPLTLRAGRTIAGALEDLAAFLGAREILFAGPVPAEWRRALR